MKHTVSKGRSGVLASSDHRISGYHVVMFSETESCPYIFTSKWISHEDSCAAVNHDCITCKYCMANINYWGAVDDYMKTELPTTSRHSSPYKLNQPGVNEKKTNTQIARKSGQSKIPATTIKSLETRS